MSKLQTKDILVGLGWDVNWSGKEYQFDLDASCVMINAEGQVEDIVFYHQLKSRCHSVTHMGDNVTGKGKGDDEQILVRLEEVPENIEKLVFMVNIFCAHMREQHFGLVQNAYIRMVDQEIEEEENQELLRFSLEKKYKEMTNMAFAVIYREDGEWATQAIGIGTKDISTEVEADVEKINKGASAMERPLVYSFMIAIICFLLYAMSNGLSAIYAVVIGAASWYIVDFVVAIIIAISIIGKIKPCYMKQKVFIANVALKIMQKFSQK